MPLKSGKRNFKHNVQVEYRALRRRGLSKAKAMKQAVAIAFSTLRKGKSR
jgi:hypothetical protein